MPPPSATDGSARTGKTQTKNFVDAAAANKHADGLIRQKLAKGYVECAAV